MAGLPLPRFLEILSSLKIPVVEGGTEELQEDLRSVPWRGVRAEEQPRLRRG